jgi:FHS family L-fucose permease-like MFS transporter
MRLQTLPIFLTFLLMGVADAMGPLSDAVKNQYQLSNVVSTLLAFFVFIAFAVFSVPGGFLAARIGKKKLLLLGLALNVLATLVPSVMEPNFTLLLACIFLLGIGTTFLQVAGNPIMRDVSAPGNYSRNLSFAQGIKGIGSTVSTYLVTAFASIALFKNMGWRGSFPLFCILMFIALVAVAALKVEETQVDKPPGLGGALALLGQPVFFFAVLGIFLYVGAEASMGRFLFPFMKSLGMDEPTASKFGSALFFAMLTVGRLLGGFVLMVMSARTCFRLSALLGLLGGLALMSGSKPLAIFGVFAAGLGFANIWPMLFSITVEEKPERANELSGLMCMAISGGALVPLLMGRFLDMGWKSFSFIVPVACFVYLLVLSLRGGKKAVAAAPAKA